LGKIVLHTILDLREPVVISDPLRKILRGECELIDIPYERRSTSLSVSGVNMSMRDSRRSSQSLTPSLQSFGDLMSGQRRQRLTYSPSN
jgi:hypothetical protein